MKKPIFTVLFTCLSLAVFTPLQADVSFAVSDLFSLNTAFGEHHHTAISDIFDLNTAFQPDDRIVLELTEGWNMISINISPVDDLWQREEGPDVISMLDQLRIDDNNHHVVLFKNGAGQFYLPAWGYNSIPYWNLIEGYQVKVDEELEAVWQGEPINADTDIPLIEGWNIIAYFPTYELDASRPDFYVLSPIIDHVWLAKQINGAFMIPEWGYSNMPPWRETQGYQVKVDEDVVLNYPEEPEDGGFAFNTPPLNPPLLRSEGGSANPPLLRSGGGILSLRPAEQGGDVPSLHPAEQQELACASLPPAPQGGVVPSLPPGIRGESKGGAKSLHWTFPKPTGRNMSVLILEIQNSKFKTQNSQIAAFNSDGLLVGVGWAGGVARKVAGGDAYATGLAVWGDDPTTDLIDGLQEGEAFQLRLGNDPLQVTRIHTGPGMVYATDEFTVLEAAVVSVLPADFSLSEAFPNPFNSVTRMTCALPVDAKVSVCVYDLEGRLIEKLVDNELTAGRHTVSWDGAAVSSGVYVVGMRSGGFNQVRKIVLVK